MATETGTTGGLSLQTDSLTPIHWVGIALALLSGVIHLVIGVGFLPSAFGIVFALALLSGVIHLVIGVGFLPSAFGIVFVLAGLGFFGAVALVLLDVRRRLVYLVGIPFVGVQIAIWYQVQVLERGLFNLGPLDYVDKAAQVVLIVILLYLIREER